MFARTITGIHDEFTEVEDLGGGRYRYRAFTRSGDARGPFRQLDGVWGSLRDLFDASLENQVDILLTRGAHGVRISPFVRFGGQDRYVRDVIDQFPGAISQVEYERHGLKYAASFIDTNGRLQGLGFDFAPIGDVTLRATTEAVIIGGDADGNPITWDVPVAVINFRGTEIARISSIPLLKPEDPEWRPYRTGTKVRIDLARVAGRVVEIDPTATIYTDNDINGWITFTAPSTPISATNTGTFKQVGRRIFPTAQRYNAYDRFDTTSLDADAIVTDVILHWRASLTPYTEGGDGPSNAVWRFYQAWNELTDPLNSADLYDVRDAAGAITTEIDSDEIQDPASKEFYEFALDPAWIRGGSSELHDVEVYDHSAYDAGDARIWSIERTSDQPYLEIIYVLPPTIAMASASATIAPQALDVVPGSITKALASSSMAIAAQDEITLAILVKLLGNASLSLSGSTLDVVPGAVTKALASSTMAVTAEELVVSAVLVKLLGVAGISVDPLSLQPRVLLDVASAVLEAPALTVLTGPRVVALNAALATFVPQVLDVVPGEKITAMGFGSITIDPQDVTTETASFAILLASAALSISPNDVAALIRELAKVCEVSGSSVRVRATQGSSKQRWDVDGVSRRVHAVRGDAGCECC